GGEIARKSLVTTSGPAKVALSPDRDVIRADRNDLAFITVGVLDDEGRLVKDDDRVIRFEMEGDAELVAVGNANPTEMKSFQANSCITFQGQCLLVVRPKGVKGESRIRAYAENVDGAVTTIEIR